MIARIARKEFLELVRDGRFRWMAGVVAGLLLLALGAGVATWRELRAQHEAAARLTREHWLTQGSKNPHSAAHYGIYAFKPALPLSFVDNGVNPYTGVTVWLEAHRQKDFLYRPAQDATAAQRLGMTTAATVLQVLVPLLIILLGFGAFAGEREQGTLRQLLSLGVPPASLAQGKALGIAGALATLLVPAAVLGSLAIVLTAEAVAPTLPRVLFLTLVYLAYFAVFVCVTLAVSARARSSRSALVFLLAFWILNALIVPRASADLARRAHPAPSSFAFARRMQDQMANGLDGRETADARRAALERRLLAEHKVARVEDLPVNFDGVSLQDSEEYGNRVFDRNYAELWETFGRQSRLHEMAGVVAPLLAVRSLSMSLAGTDFEQHRHFAAAAERYRRELVKAMNDDLAHNSRTGETYLADERLWAQLEDFDYAAPSAAWALGNRGVSLAVLGLWLAGAVAGGTGLTRRPRTE